MGPGHYIQGTIKTFEEIIPSIHIFRSEYMKLLYNLVWSLGILNSEHYPFSDEFVKFNGIKVTLDLINMYGNWADFDEELENVVTYALCSACYDNERDYEHVKPIIPFL